MNNKIISIIEKIERIIIVTLLFSLMFVVAYSTIVFLGLLFTSIVSNINDSFAVEKNILFHAHQIFSGFMLILIGIELVHTVKIYLKNDVVHVEVVLLVALIGVSRHLIDLNFKHIESMNLVGLGVVVLALSTGYFLIKKGMALKNK